MFIADRIGSSKVILHIRTTMILSLLSLFLFLNVQLVTIESFQCTASLHARSVSASSDSYAKRSIILFLAQENDGNANEGNEQPSSPSDGVIDLDWKAIADYVFDETVDSAEKKKLFQSQDQDPNRDDEELNTKETPHLHSKPIILFDGICNLCNGGVNFAIDHDKSGKFRFASLQSNVAKSLLLRDGKDPLTTSDVVLVTSEKAYYSSEAVAKIMSGLDLPLLKFLGVMGQVTPSFARNVVYRIVSGNRFMLGESDSCRMDFDGEYTSRFVSDPPESFTSATKKEE